MFKKGIHFNCFKKEQIFSIREYCTIRRLSMSRCFVTKKLVKQTIVVYTWKPVLYSETNQPRLNELKWYDLLDREKNCGRENQLVTKGSVDNEIMFCWKWFLVDWQLWYVDMITQRIVI